MFRQKRLSQTLLIVLLMGLTIASLWGLAIWKTFNDRQIALAQSGTEAQNLAHSLGQHAAKTFSAVGIVLLGTKQYLTTAHASSADVNQLLADYVKNVPQLREVGVLSRDGTWIYSSFDQVPSVNNFDREYFQYHLTHPDDDTARISAPLTSRVSGRQTILMTRRLSDPDGQFTGVVFGAIDLDYFRSFYQSFEHGVEGNVTLLNTHGRVLVHRLTTEVGKDLSGSELFKSRLRLSTTGLYRIVSPFDGILKQFAYERLQDMPIVVSVAIPERHILEAWENGTALLLGGVGLISLILAIVGGALLLQVRMRKTSDKLLAERDASYRLLAENVDDVVTRIAIGGIRLYISPSVERMTGWQPSELVGRQAVEFVHPDHREVVRTVVRSLTTSDRHAVLEYLNCRKDGSSLWVESRFTAIFDEYGNTVETVAVIRDISQRKAAEELLIAANEKLKAQSETDGLTGIANRRKFDEAWDRESGRAQRQQSTLSVLLIDVDMFKAYNDTYGHAEGDKCLQQVARAISDSVQRPTDLAARYGGEEFTVILPETSASNAAMVAEKIRAAVLTLDMIHERGPAGKVSVSIGVAGGTLSSQNDGSKLLKEADRELYRAKSNGRNCVCIANLVQFRPRLAR